MPYATPEQCQRIRDPGNRQWCVLTYTYHQSMPLPIAQMLVNRFQARLASQMVKLREAQTRPGNFAPALAELDLPGKIAELNTSWWALDWHRKTLIPAVGGGIYPEFVNAPDPRDGQIKIFAGRDALLQACGDARTAMAGTDALLRGVDGIGLDDFLVSVAAESGRIAGEVAGGLAKVAGQAIGAAAGSFWAGIPWWVKLAGAGVAAVVVWKVVKK